MPPLVVLGPDDRCPQHAPAQSAALARSDSPPGADFAGRSRQAHAPVAADRVGARRRAGRRSRPASRGRRRRVERRPAADSARVQRRRTGVWSGVDIGSRTVRFALADLQGRVLARDDTSGRARDSCEATVDQVLAGIDGRFREVRTRHVEALRDWHRRARHDRRHDRPRDQRRRISRAGPNVPLRDLVQARFKAPVQVDNDANMAALGERWQGVGAAARTISSSSRSAPASAPASSSAGGSIAAITGTRGKSAA